MTLTNTNLKALLQFIREHRSNAVHFSKLEEKLAAELRNAPDGTPYHSALTELKNKYATAYTEALAQGGTAWPEFESFIAHFERGILAELKE